MKKIAASLLIISILISGCSLFKKNPQEAVDEGIAEFVEVKKMTSSLTVSGVLTAPQGEKPSRVKFTFKALSKSDLSDGETPKLDTTFNLNTDIDDKKASGKFSFRVADKKAFMKVDDIAIEGLNDQLKPLFGIWWSLPIGEKGIFGNYFTEQKQLMEALKTSQLLTNASEEGKEAVEGVESVRYRVDLNKDSAKKFLLDLARLAGNIISPEEELAISDSLKEIEFSGAAWIGDDDALHRVRGTIAVQPAQGTVSSFDIDYVASNFGKNVEVVMPESAQEFNPLVLLPLIGAFTSPQEEEVGTTTKPSGQ